MTVRNFRRSEYVGVDGGEIIEAKSLADVSDLELATALLGIARLWGIFADRREDFLVLTGPTRIGSLGASSYLFLLISQWLQTINHDLERFLVPVFRQNTVHSDFLYGAVDIAENDLRNLGLVGQFRCRVPELTFAKREMRVLRDAIDFLSTHQIVRSQNAISSDLRSQIAKARHLVHAVPASANPRLNAQEVQKNRRTLSGEHSGRILTLPPKLRGLNAAIEFAIDILLSQQRGPGEWGLSCSGLVMNMNYLLEFVLQKAMESVGGELNKDSFPDRRINHVVHRGAERVGSKIMKPDCFGSFHRSELIPERLRSRYSQRGYVIDAKHKLFKTESDELNDIHRDDFYQIVGYASTHLGQLSDRDNPKPFLYGLVGLEDGPSGCGVKGSLSKYVNPKSLSSFCIEYSVKESSKTLEIINIPIRFGAFLYDVGISQSSSELATVFRSLGIEILEACAQHEDKYPRKNIKSD